MINNIEANKNLHPIVTEMFITETKLKISFVFMSQSYFEVPKIARLIATR